jgi:hypothetical protein
MFDRINIVPTWSLRLIFFLLLPSKIKKDETETMPNLKEIKNWRGTVPFLLFKRKIKHFF